MCHVVIKKHYKSVSERIVSMFCPGYFVWNIHYIYYFVFVFCRGKEERKKKEQEESEIFRKCDGEGI